jgi:hypothetical protein
MGSVGEHQISLQRAEGPVPQRRFLDFNLPDSPEMGFQKIMEGGQQRPEGQLEELKMVRLQEQSLVPE